LPFALEMVTPPPKPTQSLLERSSEVVALAKGRADAVASAELKFGKDSVEAQAARCNALPDKGGVVLDLRASRRPAAGEIRDFADWLGRERSVTDLDLGWIALDEAAVGLLVAALSGNSALRRVSLANTGLGPLGAEVVGGLLRVSGSLRSLNLSGNGLGDEGARRLAVGLRANRSLLELHLWTNDIGDQGAEAIADAVKENGTLTELHLLWNKIGDPGARCFASALRAPGHRALKRLHLSGNVASIPVVDELKRTLVHIDVQG